MEIAHKSFKGRVGNRTQKKKRKEEIYGENGSPFCLLGSSPPLYPYSCLAVERTWVGLAALSILYEKKGKKPRTRSRSRPLSPPQYARQLSKNKKAETVVSGLLRKDF